MTTEEKKDDCACGGLDAVYASIDALVDFARKRLELDPRDADWTRNRIFVMRTRASRGATSARCAPSPPRSATNRGSGSSPRTGTSTSTASA